MIGIRPASAELYQTLAAYRRTMATHEDIEAEDLRIVVGNLLEVCEWLLRSVDDLQNTIEDVVGVTVEGGPSVH